MKKLIFPFITLALVCLLLSSSFSEAAPKYASKVIDIEGETTEDGTGTAQKFGVVGDEDEEEDDENLDEDSDEDSNEDSENDYDEEEDNESSNKEDSTESKKDDSSSKNNLFDKSGKDSVDEAINNSKTTIMDDDWEFGDDLLPEVDEESFFEHIYNKMWAATTALQKIVCIIAIMFFIMSLVMVLISALGNRAKLPWYLFSALLSAIIFTCSLYAPQIVSAFNNWFIN